MIPTISRTLLCSPVVLYNFIETDNRYKRKTIEIGA